MKKSLVLAVSLTISMMVCAQTKEAAVLFSDGSMDNSFLLTDNVSVVFDSDGKGAIYAGSDKMSDLDLTKTTTAEFRNAFNITANQDPKNTSNYYATFYSEEGAYKLPETTKAYAGAVEETNVLKLTDIGNIIHKKEPVILRASQSNITLMPSANEDGASTTNALTGTETKKTLGTTDYALSKDKNGVVGFYSWNGKEIGANKAYLALGSAASNAFTFMFDDGTTTGLTPQLLNGKQSTNAFDLNGIKVSEKNNGFIIKNGRTYYKPKK